MPITILLNYPATSTPYVVPSSAMDTNWATGEVTFLQAVAAAINANAGTSTLISWAEQLALSSQPVNYPSLTEAAISVQVATGSSIDNDASSIYVTPFPLGTSITAGTPSLSAGAQGSLVLVICDPTQTMPANLTLQDEVLLSGSKLKLATAEVTLTPGQAIALKYNTTTGFWYEVWRSSLPTWAENCGQSSQPLNPLNNLEASEDVTVTDGQAGVDGSVSTVYLTPSPTNTSVTMGTPSIATSLDGATVMFINDPSNGNTGNIVLVDNGSLSGSHLRLSTNTCTLTPGSSITLKFQGFNSFWYEVARSILV